MIGGSHERLRPEDHPYDFASFRADAQKAYFGWDFNPHEADAFRGNVTERQVGCARITTATFDPMQWMRDRAKVAKEPERLMVLTLYMEGAQWFSLADCKNEVAASRGDMLLWDNFQTGSIVSRDPTHHISLVFPHALAKRHIPNIDLMVARKAQNPVLRNILASHLCMLDASADSIPQDDVPGILGATLELIGACFQPDQLANGRTAHQQAIIQRIRGYISSHLCDGAITSQDIAEEFGYSTRYIHKLFAEAGTTLSAFTRDIRLAKAAHILSSPNRRSESVTMIAFELGFCDTSHFSRSFKDRYGYSPRDFRTHIEMN